MSKVRKKNEKSKLQQSLRMSKLLILNLTQTAEFGALITRFSVKEDHYEKY